MESELPKIVQEKIAYYRRIIQKLNEITEKSKNQSFKNSEEESKFLKKEISKNLEGINILKLMREIVSDLIIMTQNPFNYQSYENKNIAYNITNDHAENDQIEFMRLMENAWDNDINEKNSMLINIKIIEGIKQQFAVRLNKAIQYSLLENDKNKYYSKFQNFAPLEKSIFFIKINDFQAIQNISEEIPVDAQFVVLTGENGDGKTSILQAIGLGLYNPDELSDKDIGKENSRISIKYQEKDKFYTNYIFNNPKHPVKYAMRSSMKSLKQFTAYGAARLRVFDNKEKRNPLLNFDSEKAKLTNVFNSWLRDISANDEKFFEKIKSIILDILPNVSEIKKKDKTKPISDFLFIEKGIEVEFKHLSAGHKSIVLMIGDMIMRLSEAQPEIKNPSDFTGIVLIDEIEAHLHPKWQKEFPHILSTTFPKVQFIVTTHSAISLLGMPENTVFFRVQRSEEKGTYIERMDIDVKNLLPNAIYTSPLFDMESIRSTENNGIEELNVEDNFDEIIKKEENKKRLKELSKKFVFTPPKS
ncbi:AAA family ATPase [Bernardetia sp. ABR2-2B]|uniref:AAA family ATPase n=1 Tax=Bernardetia sp. ABR2-2B TaxID=3127472 RepID=UPI0030D412F2